MGRVRGRAQLEQVKTSNDVNVDELSAEFSKRVQATEKRLQAVQKA